MTLGWGLLKQTEDAMGEEKDQYEKWNEYLGAVENRIEKGQYDAATIHLKTITALALVDIARSLNALVHSSKAISC